MQNYINKVSKLRKEMVADIEEYLKSLNRAVIVKAGHLSYLNYNLASNSTSEDELELVPDVEITMLVYDKDFGFTFTDACGHEGTPSELSTDEMWAVCDYLFVLQHGSSRHLTVDAD